MVMVFKSHQSLVIGYWLLEQTNNK